MNDWTGRRGVGRVGESRDPLEDSGGLWTRRGALALTAGFLAVGAMPARASAYVQTPAPRATSIVVSKTNRVLELRNAQGILKRYRVALGFDPAGHKVRSGDGRTPEGQYFIDRRNPRSDFYLSLGISYPNSTDLARAQSLGVKAGGDIFIHGGPNQSSTRRRGDWTAGCISVTDAEMEEIWSLVPTGVPITILA